LQLGHTSLLTPVLALYKLSRKLNMDWLLKSLVLPPDYKAQIKELDYKAS